MESEEDINFLAGAYVKAIAQALSLPPAFYKELRISKEIGIPPGVVLEVGDQDKFSATVLRVPFKLVSRPIVLERKIGIMEHCFVGSPDGGSPIQVWVYQHPGGILYIDSSCTIRLCDVGSTYLSQKIASMLVLAVINSGLYDPG